MADTSTATGTGTEPDGGTDSQEQQAATFTQADVDRIVKERVQRVRAQFADYDDLKAKAAGAQTVEERLSAAEERARSAEQRALRNDIATRHGISAEDRDLFLTGTDEETLAAQAKRLAERESERRKQGNVAPNEGANPDPGASKGGDMREFTRSLFQQARAG